MSSYNTFKSLKADTKETYSDNKKKKNRFKRTKKMLQPPGKATAELEASKDPMGFLERNKNMSIRGLKGVAF
jgi:hypothetical protein